jgi:2-dehydropantoate 2-reductase
VTTGHGEIRGKMTPMIAVSVIGLGAMGASYAAKLHDSPLAAVTVIAEGARAERLRRDGVRVNGVRHRFPVVEPDTRVEPADLVIVAVKYTDFAEALPQIAHHIGDNTVVICLLNGITSEAEVQQRYPQSHPLLSITFGVDAVRVGHDVTYSSLGRIGFGLAHNREPYAAPVVWLADLFDSAGLRYEIFPDMIHQLWWKYLVNTGVNQVTAALEAPYAIVQPPQGPARDVMIAAQREVVRVGQAEGIDLSEADIDSWLEVLDQLGPRQYTSMAQDVLARRPTEVEVFAGAIMRLAAKHGIAVPVNTCLYQLITAKQALWGLS